MAKPRLSAVAVVLLAGLRGGEAQQGLQETHMSDFKLFGPGSHRLLQELNRAVGGSAVQLDALKENVPTEWEQAVLSGRHASEEEYSEEDEQETSDEADLEDWKAPFSFLETPPDLNPQDPEDLAAETSDEDSSFEGGDQEADSDAMQYAQTRDIYAPTKAREHAVHPHQHKLREAYVDRQPYEGDTLADQTSAEEEMLREAKPTLVNGPSRVIAPDAGMDDLQVSDPTADWQPGGETADIGAEPHDAYESINGADPEAQGSEARPTADSTDELAAQKTTEEELAEDLQHTFPKIAPTNTHEVQRRHIDQDIKLTEGLRSGGQSKPTERAYTRLE